MNNSLITVLIADDHPIFQRGLQQIIETDENLKIVASVSNGEDALENLRKLKPQVAVLDIDMPKRDGFSVLKSIREDNLPSRVVLLTMHSEERFLNVALKQGAKGYVLKDGAANEIITAIYNVAEGKSYISPELSTQLFSCLSGGDESSKNTIDSLTPTERRVLKMVSESKSSKQIADELFISIRTVDNHRSNICAKLGLEGKNSLLTYALNHKTEI